MTAVARFLTILVAFAGLTAALVGSQPTAPAEGPPGASLPGEAWNTATALRFVAPGLTGDLALSIDVQFDATRTCDFAMGASGPPRSSKHPILFWGEAIGDEGAITAWSSLEDGLRVQAGPVDSRSRSDQVAYVTQSLLGTPGGAVIGTDWELSRAWTFRLFADEIAPSDRWGQPGWENSGFVMELACDGAFTWGNFLGSRVVVGFTPATFSGPGLSAAGLRADQDTVLAAEIGANSTYALFWNPGGTMETGTLRLRHPDGEESWNLSTMSRRTSFEGRGGTYEVGLNQISVAERALLGLLVGFDPILDWDLLIET